MEGAGSKKKKAGASGGQRTAKMSIQAYMASVATWQMAATRSTNEAPHVWLANRSASPTSPSAIRST